MHQKPSPVPAGTRCVFVYGTLRRGQANDITRLRPAPRLLGRARVRGRLYHLGAYPGVVLSGDGWVLGEVYAIEAALEARLDEIEMIYPQQRDEYVKRQLPVTVQLAGGGEAVVECLCYEINPAYLQDAPLIASGDWMQAA